MTFYRQIVPNSMSTPSSYCFQIWSSCFYKSVISLTKTHWAAPERGDALTPSCNPKLCKEIILNNFFFGSSSFCQKVPIVHCLGTCLLLDKDNTGCPSKGKLYPKTHEKSQLSLSSFWANVSEEGTALQKQLVLWLLIHPLLPPASSSRRVTGGFWGKN